MSESSPIDFARCLKHLKLLLECRDEPDDRYCIYITGQVDRFVSTGGGFYGSLDGGGISVDALFFASLCATRRCSILLLFSIYGGKGGVTTNLRSDSGYLRV